MPLKCAQTRAHWPDRSTGLQREVSPPFPLPPFHFFLPSSPHPHPSPRPFSFLPPHPTCSSLPPSLASTSSLTLLSPFRTHKADSPWASWVIFLDVFGKALLQVSGPGRPHTHTPAHIPTPPSPRPVLRHSAAHPSTAPASTLDVIQAKGLAKNAGPSAEAERSITAINYHYYYPIHCQALDPGRGNQKTCQNPVLSRGLLGHRSISACGSD